MYYSLNVSSQIQAQKRHGEIEQTQLKTVDYMYTNVGVELIKKIVTLKIFTYLPILILE